MYFSLKRFFYIFIVLTHLATPFAGNALPGDEDHPILQSVVKLQLKDGYETGAHGTGTVVSVNNNRILVLTCAHGISWGANPSNVVVKRTSDPNEHFAKVVRVFVHENFDSISQKHDLALVIAELTQVSHFSHLPTFARDVSGTTNQPLDAMAVGYSTRHIPGSPTNLETVQEPCPENRPHIFRTKVVYVSEASRLSFGRSFVNFAVCLSSRRELHDSLVLGLTRDPYNNILPMPLDLSLNTANEDETPSHIAIPASTGLQYHGVGSSGGPLFLRGADGLKLAGVISGSALFAQDIVLVNRLTLPLRISLYVALRDYQRYLDAALIRFNEGDGIPDSFEGFEAIGRGRS